MKKLLYTVSALAALALLAPSAGFAAGAFNQFGIYTDVEGDFSTASITTPTNTPFSAYFVITNPYNDDLGTAIPTVSGFECQVLLPATGLFTLAAVLPPNMLNVGTVPDYIVGGESQPAVGANNAVLMISFQFMATTADPMEIFLAPSSAPSIPGTMAIADGADPAILISCYPSSGDFALPVFGINTAVVATENESWGGVKALFR